MTRWMSIAAFVLLAPMAQAQVGTFGACIMETANGEPINVGACELRPAQCDPLNCTKAFHWQADDFVTVITGGGPQTVHDGFEMNGQTAYAPVAMIDSDPRDCIYNEVSEAVFCFMSSAEAHMLAVDGVSAHDALVALAAEEGAVARAEPMGETDGDDGGAGDEIAGLIERLQGKYRPVPDWDCGEIGAPGGATAIQGSVLYGLETACELHAPRVVGKQGALLFDARCEGEGSSWEDEYLLRLDDWGNLVFSSLDSANLWQACD